MDPSHLAAAFTVWAAVVAMVGGGIVFELARLRTDVRAMASQLNEMAVDFEHRLTVVETDIKRCNVLMSRDPR